MGKTRTGRAPVIDGDIARIPLTKGFEAIIDAEDINKVINGVWWVDCIGRSNYARTYLDKKKVRLHQIILPTTGDFIVDHINSDGLDCRKINLRIVTRQQNASNQRIQSHRKWKGCSWVVGNRTRHWMARIKVCGKYIFLGYHLTEEEAARAYDKGALEHFGEFALLNFPK